MDKQPLDYPERDDSQPPRWFAQGVMFCGALVAGLVGLVWILL